MSEQKNETKTGYRSLMIVILFALISAMSFSFCTRTTVNGSNSGSELAGNDGASEASLATTNEVIVLSGSNFDRVISNGVVLVDFWATWCPPCRIQGPIIDELATSIGDVATITKLDVDQNGPIAARYQVRSIPTLIIFKDGEPVKRFVGVQQKETLAAAIKELI